MSEEIGKGDFEEEGVPGIQRNLEVSGSNGERKDFKPVVEGANQTGNVTMLAKIQAGIDSTWSHLHKTWTEMGHDAETVSGLEEGLMVRFKEFLESVRSESFHQRYYNGDGVQIHPLLADNVLDKILEYVLNDSGHCDGCGRTGAGDAQADIRNARLVCNTWNDRALALMLRTGPTIIFDRWDDFDGDWERGTKFVEVDEIRYFIEVMKDSKIIPFQRYSLSGEILTEVHSELLRELFQVIGPTAIELRVSFGRDLDMPRQPGYQHFQNFAPDFKFELLMLKKLEFVIKGTERVNDMHGVAHFMKMLLLSVPQLTELNFDIRLRDPRPDQEPVPIPNSLDSIPTTVKKLTIFCKVLTDFYFQKLAEANLQLNKLTMNCENCKCSASVVKNFFEKQSDSLTHLIVRGKASKLLSSDFPQLKNVRCLVVKAGTAVFTPFSIADHFPAVRKLKINYHNSPSKTVAPLVEDLWLEESVLQSDQQIKSAKECFPNVKILTVWLCRNGSKMESVFTHFSQIEELHIRCNCLKNDINGDSLISGLPKAVCEGMQSRDKEVLPKAILEFVNHLRKPSILDLPRLKKLGLWNMHGWPQFTNLSAHHILQTMTTNLEELEITIQKSRINHEYSQQLKERLKKFLH